MAGTPEGGRKAAATMKAKYGSRIHETIGKQGGRSRKNPYNHFEALKEKDPEALRELSAKAGHAGKREQQA